MFDRFDPRDRDDDPRDGGDIYDPRWDNDPRDRDEDWREPGRDRDRDRDPRDAFVEGLDLPRGLEREIVLDSAIAPTSSMARTAARWRRSGPFGLSPRATSAILARGVRPTTTIDTCEIKG